MMETNIFHWSINEDILCLLKPDILNLLLQNSLKYELYTYIKI